MEDLPKDRYLEFNPGTLLEVRKLCGFEKPQDMRNAIDILDNWVQQQNHFLKKDFSKEFLERLVIGCKGSVERAKVQLDKLCTLRTLMRKFYGDYDIRNDLTCLSSVTYLVLPKLTKENDRVIISKWCGSQFSSSVFLDVYRFICIVMDYIRCHDYICSCIFLVDVMDASLSNMISGINLVDLRQIVALRTGGYAASVKGMHIFTTSNLIDTMISIVRPMMKAKVADRIQVHKSLEAVNNFVSKDILPIEYGGNERSMAEIKEEWIGALNSKEFRDYRRKIDRACTDESLRQTDTYNEQYMGMPGTFRSLSVD